MTAPAFSLALKIEQGATFDKQLTWKVGAAPGTPVDLTGCTALLVARKDDVDGDVLFTLSTGGHGITLGGAAGTIALLMTPSATAALDFEVAQYNLEITFPSGVVRRLTQGFISFSREVKP